MVHGSSKNLGYLESCMDRRFLADTREAFEKATDLGANDYWHQAFPGGAAVGTEPTGLNYAVAHGADTFGWQAHLDGCGGQPGVEDAEIRARLQTRVNELQAQYPGRHFMIVASNSGIEINEV